MNAEDQSTEHAKRLERMSPEGRVQYERWLQRAKESVARFRAASAAGKPEKTYTHAEVKARMAGRHAEATSRRESRLSARQSFARSRVAVLVDERPCSRCASTIATPSAIMIYLEPGEHEWTYVCLACAQAAALVAVAERDEPYESRYSADATAARIVTLEERIRVSLIELNGLESGTLAHAGDPEPLPMASLKSRMCAALDAAGKEERRAYERARAADDDESARRHDWRWGAFKEAADMATGVSVAIKQEKRARGEAE